MGKVKIISNQLGVCPYCNSEDINYGQIQLEADHVYYPCECNTCGRYFQEWNYLQFVGHNVGPHGEYEASYILDEEIDYE